MLGNRLQLAYDLYPPCDLAADIGTDHARLPAALLRSGKCKRMILSDISESALSSARRTVAAARLEDRAELRLGDGLQVLREECEMVSILGMGGKTIQDMLMAGSSRLRGASLLLSAHSNLHLLRQGLSDIGYSPVSETPCLADGRFYLMILARPGGGRLTPREIRLGRSLFDSASPLLLPYLRHRREVLESLLSGVQSARWPDESEIETLREDIAFYRKEEKKHEGI